VSIFFSQFQSLNAFSLFILLFVYLTLTGSPTSDSVRLSSGLKTHAISFYFNIRCSFFDIPLSIPDISYQKSEFKSSNPESLNF